MTNPVTGVPSPTQIIDRTSFNLNAAWYQFFVNLWNRTGGASPGSPVSLSLDAITNVIGSLLTRGNTVWQGIPPGTANQVLIMGATLPGWGSVVPASFGSQASDTFLAAPSGSPGNPTFRVLTSNDFTSVRGQYLGTGTNDSAGSGNIGEYISATAIATALTSATAKDLTSISLSPGDWDVWANLTTSPAGTTTQSDIRGWISLTSATDPGPPNSGAYAELQTSIAAGLSQTLSIGLMRVSIAAAASAFLSTKVTFATSTLSASGFIAARRVR